MAVDYDLVIIGGTPAGAIAAQTAARWGARVAWIWQGADLGQAHLQYQGWLWGTQRWAATEGTASLLAMSPPVLPDTAWQAVRQWADLIADLPRLPLMTAVTAAGVDILQGNGQVVGDRPLRVQGQGRTLSTRRLLLALASAPHPPQIPGADTLPWLTPATLLALAHPPVSVGVVGQQPEALALALALATWGTRVHILSTAPTLLPQEDPAVAQWLQAQLAAAGIALHLGVTVERLETTPQGVQVTWGSGQADVAAALLGTRPRPQGAGLNLAAVGLDLPSSGLGVNGYLQSAHGDIYGCGGSLGGYDLPTLSAQEAAIAVENALFWPRRRIDYSTLPYGLWTDPALGRVGLTEPQARRRYGEAIRVYTSRWDDQPAAHWRGTPTGFCKLIVRGPDTLVGVHGVGPEVPTLVASVAPWVGRRGGMVTLALAAVPPASALVAVQQAVLQWQGDRWQPGQWRRDWAENWCHWRRSRRG